MDLMANGKTALLAFQQALVTTSHNIANVYTEGYTRQEVQFTARVPEGGNTSVGAGVEVSQVRRAYNEYLTAALRYNTSTHGNAEIYESYAADIDRLFANPDTGLTSQLTSFFNAMETVSNDPTSIPNRQIMVGEMDLLANRIREIDTRLDSFQTSTNREISDAVIAVNTLSSQIAEMNTSIERYTQSGANVPNDLYDKRDLLVNQLSKYLRVDVTEQYDGTVNVSAGSGQNLVIGKSFERLGVTNSEYGTGDMRIVYITDGGSVDVTDQLASGMIGGVIEFQKQMLQPAQNEIDRLATIIADTVNTQHQAGFDLDGNAGAAVFTTVTPSVDPSANNTGTANVSAVISDSSQLKANNYVLAYSGGAWKLTRSSDGSEVTMSGTGTALDPFVVEGVTITVDSGVPQNGDKFLLAPSRNSAAFLDSQITDPRKIAASAIAGTVGDNTNAVALAALSNATLVEGSLTLDVVYQNLVTTNGSKASQAIVTLDAQKVMLTEAQTARDEESGVNLDEEAANLLMYQQAYQAAARVMSVADDMFQSLLSAVGR